MKKILLGLIFPVFLAGCVTTPQNSAIWFDNKSGEIITCSVDGQVVLTVQPGKTEIYSLPNGAHTWEAKSEKNYWHGTVNLGWGEITDIAIEAPGN